jgi:thiamine transport system permease protein
MQETKPILTPLPEGRRFNRFRGPPQPRKIPVILRIEKEFSKPKYKRIVEIIVLGFFFLVITAPIINIISNVVDNVGEIRIRLFEDELMGDLQWRDIQTALWSSFLIAIVAVIIDILIGFPIAALLVRGEFPGKKILDLIVDLPMAVPTSALGFSIMLFWGTFGINPGFTLLVACHVAFTFPYIVRNLKLAIEKVDPLLEKAAMTLGAPKFTIFRTITFPLVREGLIAGAILAFTRSLGETGASAICAGLVETAPIMVVSLRRQLQLPAASFLSLILIVISLVLLIVIKFLGRRDVAKQDFWQIHLRWEQLISNRTFTITLKIVCIALMLWIVLIPSFYVFNMLDLPAIQAQLMGSDNKWAYLWVAMVNSFSVGFVVVGVDLIFGIPFAFMLVREKWGRFNEFLDTVLDIPLSIPSAALGFAIFMFWGPAGLDLTTPGTPMIIFVHIVFTFPFVVRPIMATIKSVQVGHEEASATLGASSLTTFRRITLPAIKNGIIAGLIAAFTRSLGETGATLVVMGGDRTIPVLIVDWVEASAWSAAAFASVVVIILSALLLLILQVFSPSKENKL